MGVVEHRPPEPVDSRPADSALFLAGPIQGAPDWQNFAVQRLEAITDPQTILHVFNPRRPELDDKFVYEQQVAWEKAYLKRAARVGSALLFWFEAQDHSLPYTKGRRYAKTTNKELDRAFGWKDHTPVNISIGVHPEFEGLERYTQTCIDEFHLTVHTTLDDTIDNALGLMRKT